MPPLDSTPTHALGIGRCLPGYPQLAVGERDGHLDLSNMARG